MIEVGKGSFWAKNQKELTQSLFANGGTANGTYKVYQRKIMFYLQNKEPIACLCLHDHTPFFVTAFKDYGKVRYMFSYTDKTKNYLRLPDSLLHQVEIAERLKKELYVKTTMS